MAKRNLFIAPSSDGAILFSKEKGDDMETRVAIIGIIIENKESVQAINELLHTYSSYIIGRMGLPYRERKINIISVIIDAPQDAISTLSGKIGRLPGVVAKTVYSPSKVEA